MDERSKEIVDAFTELLAILRRLRAPDGCPWDRKQTMQTMAPLILEEAFEVAEAIEEEKPEHASEELGDLTMNILLTCLVAEEKQVFDAGQVFRAVAKKLINRHPHVFGDIGKLEEKRFLSLWEEIKKEERKGKNEDQSTVAGVPRAMPALLRGYRLVEKIKRVRSDLPLFNISEEQLRDQLTSFAATAGAEDLEAQGGDLLLNLLIFMANRSQNPETALRARLRKLEKSYRSLECQLGDQLKGVSKETLDQQWKEAESGSA